MGKGKRGKIYFPNLNVRSWPIATFDEGQEPTRSGHRVSTDAGPIHLFSLLKRPQQLLGHEIQITPGPGAGYVQLVAGLRVGQM